MGLLGWNALVLIVHALPSSVKSMIVFTSPSPAWVALKEINRCATGNTTKVLII